MEADSAVLAMLRFFDIVHHAHAAIAEFSKNLVMGDSLSDHWVNPPANSSPPVHLPCLPAGRSKFREGEALAKPIRPSLLLERDHRSTTRLVEVSSVCDIVCPIILFQRGLPNIRLRGTVDKIERPVIF